MLSRRGAINNGIPVNSEAEAKLERLRVAMEDKRGAVDHNVSAYVQATLEFGVAQTRKEYRGLANRNWKAIQKFGTRFIRLGVTTAVILLFLGWLSFNTTQEIQDGRRNGVLEKCHAGERFDAKLKSEIATIPDPVKREEAKANITFTEQLVSTIVPIGHCDEALKKAGL